VSFDETFHDGQPEDLAVDDELDASGARQFVCERLYRCVAGRTNLLGEPPQEGCDTSEQRRIRYVACGRPPLGLLEPAGLEFVVVSSDEMGERLPHQGRLVARHDRTRYHVTGGCLLVAGLHHFFRGRQVCPQLEPVHGSRGTALGHLLMDDPAAGAHPLHVAGGYRPSVAERKSSRSRKGSKS